ncbi:MAG: A/G-specific adenine glycosylase [Thiotrichaceae bacterium]|nr:A/G-specific adenine glycosylase [Thiotrichaceae bacterium]
MVIAFAERVLQWFEHNGRKNLPWQQQPSAYKTWVSEIMLQQTQVATVIPYYTRFIDRFPSVQVLADAEIDAILEHWAGLGYYTRARNLHKAAQQVRDNHDSQVPETLDDLCGLSGIGRSTAGAILSLAYGQSQAILDGNVKRVLSRYHAVEGWSGKAAVSKVLWLLAEQHLPDFYPAEYTQAMMDLGATVCTRTKPACDHCPLMADCRGLASGDPCRYPEKKPKKVIPNKTAYFLYLQNEDGQLLLEKRPPTGIWGGLWCLPQFDTQGALELWLDEHALESGYIKQMETISHTFSHFKLAMIPLCFRTTMSHRVMEDNRFLWYNVNTTLQGGLPAPINKLINKDST